MNGRQNLTQIYFWEDKLEQSIHMERQGLGECCRTRETLEYVPIYLKVVTQLEKVVKKTYGMLTIMRLGTEHKSHSIIL